jgi:hypothetical protein
VTQHVRPHVDALQRPFQEERRTPSGRRCSRLHDDGAERAAGINYERMPVVLFNPDDFETWLSGPTEEAFKLARSNAAAQVRIVQSGAEKLDLPEAA